VCVTGRPASGEAASKFGELETPADRSNSPRIERQHGWSAGVPSGPGGIPPTVLVSVLVSVRTRTPRSEDASGPSRPQGTCCPGLARTACDRPRKRVWLTATVGSNPTATAKDPYFIRVSRLSDKPRGWITAAVVAAGGYHGRRIWLQRSPGRARSPPSPGLQRGRRSFRRRVNVFELAGFGGGSTATSWGMAVQSACRVVAATRSASGGVAKSGLSPSRKRR
jgi:hypothetical protein